MRRNVNSDFSIVTMRRVAIFFFEFGSCKKFHAKILIARHFILFSCLEIAFNCNSFIYKWNRLNDVRLMKNIVKRTKCKWACIFIFEQPEHSRTLPPSFKKNVYKFEKLIQNPC